MTLPRPVPKSVRKQLLTQSLLGAVWVLICMAPLTSRATETVAKPPLAKLDYRFDGRISRPVLENYLARSATVASLLHLASDDDLRMMQNTSVKFAGRVIWMWGSESRIDALVEKGQPFVKRIHEMDPDIVLQGAIFEIITTDVNKIPDESIELLQGLDVLILDGLRRRPHATHFSLDEAISAAEGLGAKRTLFTHISHDLQHEATNATLPPGMELAYDGMRIPLEL